MKKFISSMSLLLVLMLLPSSCAKDIVEVNGEIKGVVKDALSGEFLANCQIAISPGGTSVITGTDGSFSFLNLEPGDYTLTYTKSGYYDESKTVTITATQTHNLDVLMRVKSAMNLSTNRIDFGDLNSSSVFILSNNTNQSCNYTISGIPAWANLSITEGTIARLSSVSITATVDRSKVSEGTHEQVISIDYSNGSTSGIEPLTLKMQKVQLSQPTVSIEKNALDIAQTGFKVKGYVSATGGAEVTAYGHCWSVSHDPTIESAHSDFGKTTKAGPIETSITNLQLATTYYVRAYATNSQGTAYSDEIAVTTQDVPSTKWDGNIAKVFAGGNGTIANPYLISTGGQLMLMRDHCGKYFKIISNIDLDNKNWLPFEFYGTLDGDGHTILNLKVDRVNDYQGLFSKIGKSRDTDGVVKNLTIKGVKIETNNSYVGALCGSIQQGQVDHIHVIFKEDSKLSAINDVGGIAGNCSKDSYDAQSISTCTVTAVDHKFTIGGDKYVGGIVGHAYGGLFENKCNCTYCDAKVNVAGSSYVGGIFGSGSSLHNCSFSGDVLGESYVGGIAGQSGDITACKVTNANITGSSYTGGIAGEGSNIYACYSTGTINKTNCGITGSNSTVYLCYSTMSSGLGYATDCAATGPISKGTNSQGYCTNITQWLHDAHSQYAECYNFNNTWTWEGEIQGKKVQVSCPKLSWEE